jgi:hypothetical protein
MRPGDKNGDGQANAGSQAARTNGGSNGNHGQAATRPTNANGGNGHGQTEKSNGSATTVSEDDLDQRILQLEKAVGISLYRNILREYGRVNQPKLIRDPATKRKVLGMLESVVRGIDRLDAVTKRLDPNTVKALLEKLQAPPLNEIADIKMLQDVVLGLEELARPNTHELA